MSALRTWIAGFLALACALAAQAGAVARPSVKPRVVVMTDIGGDPDDMQSLVRYLLYTCDFETEGLCTGFGHGHYKQTRPELIRERIAAYGKVVANLRRHRSDYPSAEHLLSLVKDGHNGDPHKVGPGMDSEASEWITQVLDKPDPRPVWFSIWGGPRELAQAIWKASQTRSEEQLAAFKKKIRVHSIADQDRTAIPTSSGSSPTASAASGRATTRTSFRPPGCGAMCLKATAHSGRRIRQRRQANRA